MRKGYVKEIQDENERLQIEVATLKNDLVLAKESCRPQPIETVPKDGTCILLFGPSGYDLPRVRAAVGHYAPDPRAPINSHWDPWCIKDDFYFEDDGGPPTHWMPLPEVPEVV